MLTIDEIDIRVQKIPGAIEALKAELNQLLGYKQALDDKEALEVKKEKPSK